MKVLHATEAVLDVAPATLHRTSFSANRARTSWNGPIADATSRSRATVLCGEDAPAKRFTATDGEARGTPPC